MLVVHVDGIVGCGSDRLLVAPLACEAIIVRGSTWNRQKVRLCHDVFARYKLEILMTRSTERK